MGWLITAIKALMVFLGLARDTEQIIHDSEERTAGAAEQTAKEGSEIASRDQDGAKIEADVSALSDSEIDKQLKGDGP